jgi:hypothetical protein
VYDPGKTPVTPFNRPVHQSSCVSLRSMISMRSPCLNPRSPSACRKNQHYRQKRRKRHRRGASYLRRKVKQRNTNLRLWNGRRCTLHRRRRRRSLLDRSRRTRQPSSTSRIRRRRGNRRRRGMCGRRQVVFRCGSGRIGWLTAEAA